MRKCPKCRRGYGACVLSRKTWLFRFVCSGCDFEGPEIEPDVNEIAKDAMDRAYNAAVLEVKG